MGRVFNTDTLDPAEMVVYTACASARKLEVELSWTALGEGLRVCLFCRFHPNILSLARMIQLDTVVPEVQTSGVGCVDSCVG